MNLCVFAFAEFLFLTISHESRAQFFVGDFDPRGQFCSGLDLFRDSYLGGPQRNRIIHVVATAAFARADSAGNNFRAPRETSTQSAARQRHQLFHAARAFG